jgi:hypothetical protein
MEVSGGAMLAGNESLRLELRILRLLGSGIDEVDVARRFHRSQHLVQRVRGGVRGSHAPSGVPR